MTLTPTSSAIAQAFITVTFTIGSGSGSNGGITASPSSVTWSAPVGSSTSTTLTLSTNNTTSITYSTSAQPASWLSVAPTLGLVSANSPATLYLYFNAGAVTSATTLQTTIYINYNTTSLPVAQHGELELRHRKQPAQFLVGEHLLLLGSLLWPDL